MPCPVGEHNLKKAENSDGQLGLCGPSELSSMERSRVVLQDKLTLQLPYNSAANSVESVLRTKLRYICRAEGTQLLRPRVGRSDVAEHIMSFVPEERPLASTANGGNMYADSGSANLDLFFQSVPQAKPQKAVQLHGLLEKSWMESPSTCLKQVFLLGAKKEGKQDRYSFYDAMVWLWETQPATVLANLHLVPETNYWKGLLELLARICEGHERSKERDLALYESFKRGDGSHKLLQLFEGHQKTRKAGFQHGWRPGSRLELAREALKRYDEDPLYRTLFERTAQLFAEQLKEDLASMRQGRRIGLCAKWCPLLYHSFDRRTLICEAIARWLFPATSPEFQGITERQYAFRAREKLRKALSELKEYMKVPERLMCQHRWSELKYKAVPATCMKVHAKQFEKHDSERFQEYLDALANGKTKVNTGALQPHEILQAVQGDADVDHKVAQAQWESLVERLRDAGTLGDAIAVCDVSGSMCDEAAPKASCMDVAIALSLLLAEASSGPLSRSLITFHENPRLVQLPDTKQLCELYRFARGLDWGCSTDFVKIFSLLLEAKPPPKRVFVFSDMQFNSAGGNQTVLNVVRERYAERGLSMPEIVFWNLSRHIGSPALALDKGVALISGFSAPMLKMVLQGDLDNPTGVLCRALDTPLLRRPRVVSSLEEASDLFRGPLQASHIWIPEPEEQPSVKLDEKPMTRPKKQKTPSKTKTIGTLSGKEAILAFLGKKGEKIQSLRKALKTKLCDILKLSRGVSLWLDVVWPDASSAASGPGSVKVTVEASASATQIAAALECLCSMSAGSIAAAEKRAATPRPARCEPFLKYPASKRQVLFMSTLEGERERRTDVWAAKRLAARRAKAGLGSFAGRFLRPQLLRRSKQRLAKRLKACSTRSASHEEHRLAAASKAKAKQNLNKTFKKTLLSVCSDMLERDF
eukprot:TRINITY_DN1302_c0_g1_i2.p1 TRINITY_DN1302_c0_g1~~TRINITY_DN1302_c0_g1_i2.p1  ORF type:complete len:971 (-),score=229.42 TRINITY_DN1302_c0_g1_i2:183-2972(-)